MSINFIFFLFWEYYILSEVDIIFFVFINRFLGKFYIENLFRNKKLLIFYFKR